MARLGPLFHALGPPVLVALPAIGWVASAAQRAGWASLGRDQGIFQYVAWAVGQGEVAYRDVRDVNGPVITMVHGLFQILGGADEHRFRVLDILFTAISFAIAGALIPTKKVAPTVRAAWAVAAVVALLAQYLVYGFWDTAQRESFLDWFVLVSIALGALPASGRRLFLAGVLSFVPWLGKPTFALFTASQLVAFLIEREPLKVRLHRVGIFVLGGTLGLAVPLAWIALRGDLGAWARITFVDVPAMYRFIWPRPAGAILSLPGYSTLAQMAIATSAGLLFLIVLGRLSRRALPIALMPALGLVSVVVQAKGFPYHFHPVTLGVSYGWLVALAVTWEAVSSDASLIRRGAVALAAMLVGARASFLAWNAPYPPVPFAQDKASLESPERLSEFDRIDFFPRALRDGAEYVAAKTSPSDRIQMYAMDAYFLFLAGRKSATPYIHAYDLNVDAALHGSFDPGGATPSEVETARIRGMRDAHERDLIERIERSPPAAFVFIDRSPLMSWQDSVMDFSEHCPDAARFLDSHYRQTADFDGVRVWLRNDVPD